MTVDYFTINSLGNRIEFVVKCNPLGLSLNELSVILAENIKTISTECQLLLNQGQIIYDSNSRKIKHIKHQPLKNHTKKPGNKFLTLTGEELLPGCQSYWSLRKCFKYLGYEHPLLEKSLK